MLMVVRLAKHPRKASLKMVRRREKTQFILQNLWRKLKVGEGARRAEGRRGLERMEEERMRRDREAQWLARVRGVGLVHRGRFFA